MVDGGENSSYLDGRLVKLCNDRLADAVDLQLQCKHAFWNTEADDLRQLFDESHQWVNVYTNWIGERVVEIGGVANATDRVVPTWSYLLRGTDGLCGAHAETLSTALASFAQHAREAANTSKEYGDFATADMFAEIANGVDKCQRKLVAP
jgi:starvation-inducible DNA-binding protein